ncbi:transglutaminase-like domain-containing protein [Reichenbachiella ulvae]|uniref:Transglutaminase family protein n=1 Tax=Reichenbachiella ulvae TaxID=2980104 RepID=A0ABT3CTX7_9BACT|nr:transglutaminase family protein [Reichenbachiella ulvae]MCV9387160.1 transglutaminase family protein [Reichenbachiella ulvae]
MWLRTSCSLSFYFEVQTVLIFMLRPRSGAQQWVAREEYNLSPMVNVVEYADAYGNLCQKLIASPGHFSITTNADVKTDNFVRKNPGAPFVEIQHLPETMLHFLLPSRYCESDLFNQMAMSITAGCLPGYDQVVAIESYLRDNVQYTPGSSSFPISAVEVNQQGHGVCRDLAHLGIALCRSISIPARMVVGYLHGLVPMDMHAWFEAYVDGKWYTFDATQLESKGGYVAVGYGRDSSDVAIYNQFGPASYPLEQSVNVVSIEDKV